MQRARTSSRRVATRLGEVAGHWWDAVSGGWFFTAWTLTASGLVSVLLLSPYTGLTGAVENLAAMAASLLAWIVIVVAVVPIALWERRLATRAARGILVIVTLAVVSTARPFLNDAIADALFGHASTGDWPQRIATNGLTWFVLLPLVAGARTWYVESERSAARLAAAVAVLDGLRERTARYERSNAALLADAVAQLRRQRDAMLAAHVDFAAVRDFADDVRVASHRFDERLRAGFEPDHGEAATPGAAPVAGDSAGGVTASGVADARPALLARLARPPALLIAGLYFAAGAPYTFAVGGWPLVLAALVLLAAVALGADLATRVLGRGQRATVRGAVMIVSWLVAAVVMMTAGMVLTSVDGMVLFVPLLALPGLAVVVALGTDATRRTRRHRSTVTQLLGRASAIATTEAARAREPLRRAVVLLHDRVQSRCVVFGARADERTPTAAETARFRSETDDAFDEILAGAPAAAVDDLDGLLATWSGVLDVQARIGAGVAAALQSPRTAAAVVAIVSEGFVNAVKHSAARTAALSITTDGDVLTVAIASPGTLRAVPSAGLGLASLDGRVQLRQDGADVVLEVAVPIT